MSAPPMLKDYYKYKDMMAKKLRNSSHRYSSQTQQARNQNLTDWSIRHATPLKKLQLLEIFSSQEKITYRQTDRQTRVANPLGLTRSLWVLTSGLRALGLMLQSLGC